MKQKLIVVGGGVVGLASAYEMARRGARVTVLERGRVGAESSWAGGGILFPLLPWDYCQAVTALTEWSRLKYPDWILQLQSCSGVDPEYLVSGMCLLPPFDLEKATAWCRLHGLSWRMEDEAVVLPEVAQVRNPRLMQALRGSLENMGVAIIEQAEITALEISNARVSSVQTSQGSFAADDYVVAAGAWSAVLLGNLAPSRPVWPVRGQMLLFKTEPGVLRQIMLQQGIYLIPRADGHILVGSTLEQAGFDKGVTDVAREHLASRALAMFPPLQQATLVRHWAGLRPGSKGNVPVIGRHPEITNLYLNAGHFRYGVTMAPASAEILVNMLDGKEQPLDVSPYAWR